MVCIDIISTYSECGIQEQGLDMWDMKFIAKQLKREDGSCRSLLITEQERA